MQRRLCISLIVSPWEGGFGLQNKIKDDIEDLDRKDQFIIYIYNTDSLPIIKTSPIARLWTQVSILDNTCKGTVYLSYNAKMSDLTITSWLQTIADYSYILKKTVA